MEQLRLTDTEPHTYYVAWTRYCPQPMAALLPDYTLTRSRLCRTYEEAHLHRQDQLECVRADHGTPLSGGITEVCTQLIEDEDGRRLY